MNMAAGFPMPSWTADVGDPKLLNDAALIALLTDEMGTSEMLR